MIGPPPRSNACSCRRNLRQNNHMVTVRFVVSGKSRFGRCFCQHIAINGIRERERGLEAICIVVAIRDIECSLVGGGIHVHHIGKGLGSGVGSPGLPPAVVVGAAVFQAEISGDSIG